MNMQAQGTSIDLTLPQHITSLATSAVLLTVDVSCWSATKADQSLAAQVSADNGAEENVGEWTHKLFKRDRQFIAVHNHRQSVYNYLARPATAFDWHGSTKLVPASSIEYVLKDLAESKAAFEAKVNTFLDGDTARGIPSYEDKISNQAFVRGKLFRRDHFPSKEAVRAKFSFRWVLGTVREDDFRCAVAQDLAQDILIHNRRQVMQQADAVGQALRGQLLPLLKSLSHCCAMEESDEGAIRFRRLHGATVEKALRLCDTVSGFNPGGDTLLTDACLTLRGVLSRYGSDEGLAQLKGSEMLREAVKATADDLLSKFSF